MKLFNMIPRNFFNLLSSSSNQELYSDCLFIIYEQYENEISYRIPRVRIRDALSVYLMENNIDLEDDEGNSYHSYNDKASEIIHKFTSEDVGWLEEDNDDTTFEKYITMTDHGLALVDFLSSLKEPKKAEYSFFISNVYNAMKNENSWLDNPYIAVLKLTYENIKSLSKSLKQLSTSIKNIIDELTREESFESLTNNLIRYFDGEFIKEYSRLITQQNIHFYRGYIIHELDRMVNDDELLEVLVLGYQDDTNELDHYEEAKDHVLEMIYNTKRFLSEDYDKILSEIKRKINIYLNLARARAMFLRNHEANMEGYVEQVIDYMVNNTEKMKSFVDDDLNSLFTFDKYEFIDLTSIRIPVKSASITKNNIIELEEITEEQQIAALELQRNEANNPYSKEKMKRYLERIMNGRTYITSRDLPLETKNDLLACVALTTYAKENGYRINVLDGYFESNHFLLREFEIEKEKL